MKKYQILFSVLLLLGALLSCQKTETQQKTTNIQFTINDPTNRFTEGMITTLNLTTKVERKESVSITNNNFSLSLQEGLYNVSFGAGDSDNNYRAYLESVRVTGNEIALSISPFKVSGNSNDFVIEEIFYVGTRYPDTKKGYIGDQFLMITNNSDMTLYADGLTIAESAFSTAQKYDYTPNIMSEATAVWALYTIPGNGKEYPVKPGESILLSDKALNHKIEGHPASFDLSNSTFEWYDESTNSSTDTDNPAVPNLDKIYCYTASIWILNQQGIKSYFLARMGVSRDEYLRDYQYDYSYIINDREVKRSEYKLPNSWIVDAVTTGIPDKWQWNCVDVSLDAGHTYCGENSKDSNRYGKSVRRKRISDPNSTRVILQDTNNSSVDFDRDVIPFEL